MSGDTRLRYAGTNDLEAILSVAQACERVPVWSRRIWIDVLQSSQHTVVLAEDAELLLGFSVARLQDELAELESLAVSPESRRRGIGKRLCLKVMEWAAVRGASKMLLEVRASDVGAPELYRSLGFAEQSRRKEYYRNPTDDALVMSTTLTSLPQKV